MKKLLLMVEQLCKLNYRHHLVLICSCLSLSLSSFSQIIIDTSQTNAMRYEQGLAALNTLDSNGIHSILHRLAEIAPEFGDDIVTFAYGEIYTKNMRQCLKYAAPLIKFSSKF